MPLRRLFPLYSIYFAGDEGGIRLPYIVDFSIMGNGPMPANWIGGANWTITSGKAVNSPSGTEILVDGGLENWTSATDLTSWQSETNVAREATIKHGGTYAARINADSSSYFIQNRTGLTVGVWNLFSWWLYTTGSGLGRIYWNWDDGPHNPGTTWTRFVTTQRNAITSPDLYLQWKIGGGAGDFIYWDDVSILQLVLTDLIKGVNVRKANITAKVTPTYSLANSFPVGGLIINLDSFTSPLNFVIAQLDYVSTGTVNCQLWKCVNGTYTSVIDAAISYVAGQEIKVIKLGTSYSLYYNNIQLGTTQTISDTEIINNTRHGLISGFNGNQFNSFSLA